MLKRLLPLVVFGDLVGLFRRFAIKYRLIFSFLFVSIIPLCLVAAFSFYESYGDVKEKVGNYSYEITRQEAVNIDLLLDNFNNISLKVINSDIVQNDFKIVYQKSELERYKLDDELISLLSQQMQDKVQLYGISLLHYTGGYEIHAGERLAPKDYKNSNLYQETIRDENTTLWQEPHYIEAKNPISQQKVLTYSRVIKDRWDGKVIGVLAIAAQPRLFSAIFDHMSIADKGDIFIINTKGKYIYNKNSDLSGMEMADISLAGKIEGLTAQGGKYFDYHTGNKKVIVSCSRLENNDWIVVSVAPYSILLDKTNNILFFTVIILLAFIAVSILISLIVSYSISSPIKKLMTEVNAVEKGNFDANIDDEGNDEIQHLSVSYRSMMEKVKYYVNELLKSRIAEQESQIKALKAQINPHFLYNTLETIRSIAKIRGVDDIGTIAQALSSMFRYSIKGGNDIVGFKNEIDNVRNYLDIMHIRYSDKLDIKFEIEDNLYEYGIYKLILQPIVENAIHHGISLKKGKGTIAISGCLEQTYIHISISDDGIGIKPDELEKIREMLYKGRFFSIINDYPGIGIANVNSRLALFYKENYRLEIESVLGQGTKVDIRFPAERFDSDTSGKIGEVEENR